jgi:hypothetical protein
MMRAVILKVNLEFRDCNAGKEKPRNLSLGRNERLRGFAVFY